MNTLFRCLLVPLLVVGTATAASAQKWPDHPIRFISSQAAGNTTDLLARLTGDHISKSLGQPVVVENRAGGGNVIGTQAAARSAPDGYTFFFATAAALVTDGYTFKSLPYDPMKDFTPVAKVGEIPFVILANPNVPVKTLPELIAYAKANPDKLTFATDGARRFSGMIVAWLNKLAGTNITQVPYKVQTQGIQDTIANRVQLITLAVASGRTYVASGQLKPLAVTSAKRFPTLPDVPTVAELFPGFDFSGWWLLAAPTGTPPDIITRMNHEMDKALRDDVIVKRMRSMGFQTFGSGSVKEAQDYVNRQHEMWGHLVKEIGIKPE
jgi:tripartite-type tricarboxylate transporter receptor subunit TctC